MNNIKENLGHRIQELRKARGLTQESLAEIIDMDIPNLSNIERGKKFMTVKTLEKLSDALNVPVKEIFDFDHFKDSSVLKKEIINILNRLDNKELQYIYRSINSFLEIRS